MSARIIYLIFFLILVTSLVWIVVLSYPDGKLHVITCDVGQGDASLVYFKSTQILIDGGPDRKVLECLETYVPFWDRSLEAVVLTHGEKDHYSGLIEVFKRFNVKVLLTNGVNSSASDYKVLESLVGGSGTRVVNATTGMGIRSGMISLDIVHPSASFLTARTDENVENSNKILGVYTTESDKNELSIVAVLRYFNFDALFTGDIKPPAIDMVTQEIVKREFDSVEYIKIPHHGSKEGITEDMIKTVKPKIAVISSGKNNQYGHPHKEVLDLLSKYDIYIFRTDEIGNVEVVTDGTSIRIKK